MRVPGSGALVHHSQESPATQGEVALPLAWDEALSLAEAQATLFPAFTARGRVVGCASGNVQNFNEASRSLRLHLHDRGCLAKVSEFSMNGRRYLLADPDAPFAAGDLVPFRTEHGESLSLYVYRQLGNSLGSSDSVRFAVGSIESDSKAWSLLGFALGLWRRIGDGIGAIGSPNFTMINVKVLDLVESRQAFAIQIEFECARRLRQAEDLKRIRCGLTRLQDLEIVLRADTYRDEPCDQISPCRCARLFDGSAPIRRVQLGSDIVRPGTGSKNGGFLTSNDPRYRLITPALTHKTPELMVALRSPLGYEFFNLDMKTFANNPDARP